MGLLLMLAVLIVDIILAGMLLYTKMKEDHLLKYKAGR